VSDEKQYYKTSQFIPTKGESFSFYECGEDLQVERFMTYIPETEELEKVDVDWDMELREDGIEEIDQDEFEEHWAKEESAE
jgi:protein associated with RNAse G/E